MPKKAAITAIALLLAVLASCSSESPPPGSAPAERLTMGFAQVGAESGWRKANTISITEAAAAENIELTFTDAEQSQENQIASLRSFIARKVDVIAFSPVVESGWDQVLGEAKRAGIPVILTDRAIDSTDTSLYRTFLGSDFVEEGRRAGDWLVSNSQGPVNVVELLGTAGAAPAIDRKTGFEEKIASHPQITVVASKTGDFTRDGGRRVMNEFLESQQDIDVVYAHNDDMGLGAIEAIKASGQVPGKDIKVITVDGVRDGMKALANGEINFIVECSPLLGEQLMLLAKQIVGGQEVPKRVDTDERTFTREEAKLALPNRRY